ISPVGVELCLNHMPKLPTYNISTSTTVATTRPAVAQSAVPAFFRSSPMPAFYLRGGGGGDGAMRCDFRLLFTAGRLLVSCRPGRAVVVGNSARSQGDWRARWRSVSIGR